MRKIVTVTLEVDSQFVRLLQSESELSRWSHKDQLTPSQQLALLVLGESRGALPEQLHMATLPCWRNNIEVLTDQRKVREVANGVT